MNKNELEKMNITNLFSSINGRKPSTNGRLDINSLFKTNIECDNFKFNSKILLNNFKDQQMKLKNKHVYFYKMCCEKIEHANDNNLTDITFDIPRYIPDCNLYKPHECLEYIKTKLEEEHISSVIISNTKIFITWYNLILESSTQK